jgi:hypothetical protein
LRGNTLRIGDEKLFSFILGKFINFENFIIFVKIIIYIIIIAIFMPKKKFEKKSQVLNTYYLK